MAAVCKDDKWGFINGNDTLVIDYLREKVDPACDYMIYSEMGGVYFFQFY